ncbi:MAG TPA: site-specific integrase [Humisphaera sp.]
MPRPRLLVPTYRKHKRTGNAVVTVGGRDVYLGPHGTAASRRAYDRVVGEWIAAGRPPAPDAGADLRVVELAAAFWRHAQGYYSADHGGEVAAFKVALKLLKKLYADTRITEFGPLQFRTLRDEMVRAGWARKYVNRQAGRIRHVFKWGVAEGLVPAPVWQALLAVVGLKAGRTVAPERPPVLPAPDHLIDGVLPHLPPTVRAMVELQLLTGMRPGEVCQMRGCDLDRSGELWVYRPARHKTQHHGHDRVVHLGPKAQAVLAPHLRADPQDRVFQARDADAWHRAQRTANRKTPHSCGNRPGTNVRRKPGRKPGGRFDVAAYRRAVWYACDRAFPPPADLARQKVQGGRGLNDRRLETTAEWRARLGDDGWARLHAWRESHRWHPHQLRHSAATRLRREYGLEAAQVILGHRTLSVTEVYAEKNVAAAQRIMAEVG